MSLRRRRHKHEAGPGQRLKWVWLILALTISPAIILLLTDQRREHSVSSGMSQPAEGPGGFAHPHSGLPNQPATGRTVYPFSVIDGGIVSVDELRFCLARDRIAAAHFSNFDISRAWIVKLNTDKRAYVSYRKNDHIYWTGKKIKLSKGEFLVTDGKNYARTRCANRISALPR